ncbi:calcium/sodium antiporter [Halorarius litoreus]|uniref:calcium/sodium antiporter n=1 Tax=Halorarius litoreus TaxID=2962676 RepID=UPI0020CC6F23|nr:calcium/sodium antiporter [Halorarius litoreus]
MASLVVSGALFIAGLAALLLAADRFTHAAERVGLSLGLSPFIVGVTIIAAGTSFPELVAAVLAAAQDAPGIVVGNVVGANLANVFLILGVAAVVGRDLRVDRDLMRVDLPLLVGSAFFLLVAVWDSPFTRLEGLLALAALAVYIHFTVAAKDETVEGLVDELEAVSHEPVGGRTYLVLAVSLVVVFLGAQGVVTGVTDLAGQFGVGTELIAVTVLSVGTTLPELSVTVVAARRGYTELAVGNVLGSNIFNALAVMGVPALLGPLTVAESIRGYALPVMVLGTLLYFFITQDRQITRWEGATLLLLYALFLVNLGQFV